MKNMILAVLLLIAGCESDEQVEKRVQAARITTTWKGQQFEYKTTGCLDLAGIQELGADGWEMTGTESMSGGCYAMFFKRPLVKSK